MALGDRRDRPGSPYASRDLRSSLDSPRGTLSKTGVTSFPLPLHGCRLWLALPCGTPPQLEGDTFPLRGTSRPRIVLHNGVLVPYFAGEKARTRVMNTCGVLVIVMPVLRVYRVPGVHFASAVTEEVDVGPHTFACFSICSGDASLPVEGEQVPTFHPVTCEVELADTSHSPGEQPLGIDLDDLHSFQRFVGLDQMLHAWFLVDDVRAIAVVHIVVEVEIAIELCARYSNEVDIGEPV